VEKNPFLKFFFESPKKTEKLKLRFSSAVLGKAPLRYELDFSRSWELTDLEEDSSILAFEPLDKVILDESFQIQFYPDQIHEYSGSVYVTYYGRHLEDKRVEDVLDCLHTESGRIQTLFDPFSISEERLKQTLEEWLQEESKKLANRLDLIIKKAESGERTQDSWLKPSIGSLVQSLNLIGLKRRKKKRIL